MQNPSIISFYLPCSSAAVAAAEGAGGGVSGSGSGVCRRGAEEPSSRGCHGGLGLPSSPGGGRRRGAAAWRFAECQ